MGSIGKSIICSQLVSTIQKSEHLTAAYFFCNHRDTGKGVFLRILRTLAHEILRANTGMIPIVHQRYVQKASVASTPIINTLLKEISDGIPHLRLIVDGLDECDVDVQVDLIKLVLDLRKASKASLKAIISSRDLPHIDRKLRPKITVSLYQKTDRALRIYIQNGVQQLRENFRHLAKSLVDRLEAHLLKRAGGEGFSDGRQNTRS
jgi:hypothetical protein